MNKIILLDNNEAPGKTRIDIAEKLIKTISKDNPLRNVWLFQYGKTDEAIFLRKNNNPSVDFNDMFDKSLTQSLNIPLLTNDQIQRILNIINEKT